MATTRCGAVGKGRATRASIAFVAALLLATGCSSVETDAPADAGDYSESTLRALLNSSVIDESRELIRERLANGTGRQELVSAIQEQRVRGNISPITECVQIGLINDLSDSEIVQQCKDKVEDELNSGGQ